MSEEAKCQSTELFFLINISSKQKIMFILHYYSNLYNKIFLFHSKCAMHYSEGHKYSIN